MKELGETPPSIFREISFLSVLLDHVILDTAKRTLRKEEMKMCRKF
jgi:hypothetical protein